MVECPDMPARVRAVLDQRERQTRPARLALRQRFENEVDPGRVLPAAEREARVTERVRQHMATMAVASARVRRERRIAREHASAVAVAQRGCAHLFDAGLVACTECGLSYDEWQIR